jgi:DNA-directed RNA polymerase specialized sigma subunit
LNEKNWSGLPTLGDKEKRFFAYVRKRINGAIIDGFREEEHLWRRKNSKGEKIAIRKQIIKIDTMTDVGIYKRVLVKVKKK